MDITKIKVGTKIRVALDAELRGGVDEDGDVLISIECCGSFYVKPDDVEVLNVYDEEPTIQQLADRVKALETEVSKLHNMLYSGQCIVTTLCGG